MTSEKKGTSGRAQMDFGGHKAQMGHKLESAICALVTYCFDYCILIKGTKGTNKEGGAVECEKGAKKAQKGQKQVKYKICTGTAFDLCPLTFDGILGGGV